MRQIFLYQLALRLHKTLHERHDFLFSSKVKPMAHLHTASEALIGIQIWAHPPFSSSQGPVKEE